MRRGQRRHSAPRRAVDVTHRIRVVEWKSTEEKEEEEEEKHDEEHCLRVLQSCPPQHPIYSSPHDQLIAVVAAVDVATVFADVFGLRRLALGDFNLFKRRTDGRTKARTNETPLSGESSERSSGPEGIHAAVQSVRSTRRDERAIDRY